jgi:hypothetical protein
MDAMESDPLLRSIRIFRFSGWFIGLWGVLLLASDLFTAGRTSTASGVAFVLIGIATQLYARRREAKIPQTTMPGDPAGDPAAEAGADPAPPSEPEAN